MSSKGKLPAATRDESALVPKLRFPEFIGHPLQDLQLADATAESTERNGSGQALSQIMGVSKVEGIVPMEERIVAADTARYKFVRKDWFAYNPMRLNIGSIARWQGDNDILVSPDYVVFKCKGAGPHRLDAAYLDHFRRSDAWEEFVSEKGDGSVRVRIYYKDLARLRLALPSFPEQQKIAACLDSVDTLIAAQGLKVETLRAHKKGLMQQLFPQEGETQPRLRFPEFEGAGEWSLAPLGELGDIITGKTPSTSESDLWGGDILFITPTDISDHEKYQRTTTRTVVKTKNTKVLPAGSVVYTCIASIGKMAITVHPSVTNQQINAVIPNERAPVELIYYALENLTRWIKTIPASNTLPIINKTEFSKISIPYPKNKAEQQRIADCLISLDDLIAAETRKLDTIKTHKKGLMQQLFPQVAEDGA